MAVTTQVAGVDLTATGDQTSNYLTVFNADEAAAGHNILWSGVSFSLDGFNAEGPFTYGVSAQVANATPTPSGNTSTIDRAYNLAIQKGAASVYVVNFNGALANAADGAFLQSGTQGVLFDTFGNNDSVVAYGNNDTIAAGGTGDTITVSGANDTIALDTAFSGFVTQTQQISDGQHYGSGATIEVGNGTSSNVPSSPTTVNLDLQANNVVLLQNPVSQEDLVIHNGGNTVQATAGTDTIYASAGNDLIDNYGAQMLFVGAASGDGGLDGHGDITHNDGTYFGTVGLSTINGAGGNSTVFAKAGVVFNEGSGNNVFIGGNVADLTTLNHGSGGNFIGQPQPSPDKPLQDFHSTVTGGASGYDLNFGGTVGDVYQPGGGTNLFVNGGGSDTISGGGSTPIVFGNTNGSDVLTSTARGILVSDGNNNVIDASGASQGNTFYTNDSASVGNTTLIGSNAVPTASLFDEFVISKSNNAVAHTLTLGFHTGDAVFLSGYGAADDQTFANAVNTHPAGSANFAVTLSDNTIIQFVGMHPTAAFNGGTVAI